MQAALIAGLSGPTLTADERDFFRDARPCGLILFARNLAAHDQIRALVADVRAAVGAPMLVLIDQEGGRVQRLRPPLGRLLPPAAAYGQLYAADRARAVANARLVAQLMAADLKALGIDTNCTPVLDVPVPGAHDIIGNRAFGTTPEVIVPLARAVAEGHMAGSVVPVIKHIPGHGRATADSHLALPVVTTPHAELSRTDFVTFRALADMPAAMTAHVVFAAIDDAAPASTSARVTADVIRGEIGFDGLLMSDDLGMHALTGSMRARAEAVVAAGSDVALHCSGDLAEMREAAAGVPRLTGRARDRFDRAITVTADARPCDVTAAEAALAAVLEGYSARTESV